jgi:DNA-directed RNA polymerase subunit M/transcription elongation factor TFIIS
MTAKDLIEPVVMCCPNCKNGDFMFSGLQKGYGYLPDMELWTCKHCYSTFSDGTLRVKKKKRVKA